MPLHPRNVMSQGAYPNSSFFCCVHLKLTFESNKEVGSASVPFHDSILVLVISNLTNKSNQLNKCFGDYTFTNLVFFVSEGYTM
jgi:hypothetical protein